MNIRQTSSVVLLFFITLLLFVHQLYFAKYEIKVGVPDGPHYEIMETVKKVAAEKGLTVRIIKQNDYLKLNSMVHNDFIDANSFQNNIYLKQLVADRRYNLTEAAPTVLFPIGLFSSTISNLSNIPVGADITVPNDSLNLTRSLQFLASLGLITLNDNFQADIELTDIVDNPLNLNFKPMDSERLIHSIQDNELTIISLHLVARNNLNPIRLATEQPNSLYTHIIAVKDTKKSNYALQLFLESYHSPEVKAFIHNQFGDTVIPAW